MTIVSRQIHKFYGIPGITRIDCTDFPFVSSKAVTVSAMSSNTMLGPWEECDIEKHLGETDRKIKLY